MAALALGRGLRLLIKEFPNKCNISQITVKSDNAPPQLLPAFVQKYSTSRSAAGSTPYTIVDPEAPQKLTKEIVQKVNDQVTKKQEGRLFAVVHVAGKQFKVTEGDVIVVEGYWPPDTGDRISLDKVLLAGGRDFTLIGRPLLQRGLVKVEATVIEKTLSHTKTHFRKKRRKQYMRIHFYRIPQTMLRINGVGVVGELNNPPQVSGLETVVL